MEYSSRRPRRPFPQNSTSKTTTATTTSSPWLTSKSPKSDKSLPKKAIDEYDIDRVDEVDNEVEYLKGTTRLPKATATIQEQRSLRVVERNGRTRQPREDDIDRQLKDLGVYEEGMPSEEKFNLLTVLKESQDTAAHEKSFREGTRRSGRRFSERSFEEPPTNVPSDDDSKPAGSPELFPDKESSPIFNRRNIQDNKRLTRKGKFNLLTELDSDSGSDSDLPSLTERIGADPLLLQTSEILKVPLTKTDDSDSGDISEDSSNNSSSPIPKRWSSTLPIQPVSRNVQPRLARSAAKTSFCLRQTPMVNQLSNIWFSTPDSNQEVSLPISRKRKLTVERHKEKFPFYCPVNGDTKKCALKIKQMIEEHHKQLRAYQSRSLHLMPWGEPITKVFKYAIRTTSTTSPFQTKFKKENETTVVQDEDTSNNSSQEYLGQNVSNSIQNKKTSGRVSNSVVITPDNESSLVSDNPESIDQSILKPKSLPNYTLRRKRVIESDSESSQTSKIQSILEHSEIPDPVNEVTEPRNNKLFLRQHVRSQEKNSRTNGATSMLVEPLNLETSALSQQSMRDDARFKDHAFDKLVARTVSDPDFDDEEPLSIEVNHDTHTYERVKKQGTRCLRKRSRDIPSSPKFKQEVPLKKIPDSG